jgi:hypothetical protein
MEYLGKKKSSKSKINENAIVYRLSQYPTDELEPFKALGWTSYQKNRMKHRNNSLLRAWACGLG